jgi:hypothetical protein
MRYALRVQSGNATDNKTGKNTSLLKTRYGNPAIIQNGEMERKKIIDG